MDYLFIHIGIRDENFNLNTTLEQIRLNLTSSVLDEDKFRINSYADLYKGIFKMAKGGEPAKCPETGNYFNDDGATTEECMHAAWVKNNAIVYIIGLRYDTTALGKDTLILMNPTEKDVYFDRAHQGLRDLNPNVVSTNGGTDGGKIRIKALQLIHYLQAYDLLKAGEGLPIHDRDRNGGSCTARNKLREHARNVYRQSNSIINSTSGWKKNHGIICASAIGMAAIVLNDAGTETNVLKGNFLFKFFGGVGHNPTYSPIKWYERAHGTSGGNDIFGGEDGLEDNFFIGKHSPWWVPNVPMTSHDGTAGFAEGPAYFADMATSFFCYARAADNFLPKSSKKNYLQQQRFKNLIDWYLKIQNTDHEMPSYDNSQLNHGNFVGVLGGVQGVNGYEYRSNANFIPRGVVDLRGDLIFAMGLAEEDKLDNYYYNENSGNIVLRNETKNSKHTFQMLAEKGIAIDKEAGLALTGGTHEDDDMGAFMIYAGDTGKDSRLTPLAIDPPYFGWEYGKGANTNKYWMHNTIEIHDLKIAKAYKNPKFNPLNINSSGNIQSFDLIYDYSNYYHELYGNAITRNVKSINLDENSYYIINDFIDVHEDFDNDDNAGKYIILNLNGNGNENISDAVNNYKTFRMLKSGDDTLYRWTYPCSTDYNNWGLTASVSILNNNTLGRRASVGQQTKTAYVPSEYDKSSMASGICDNTLTRLKIQQSINKTIFQSFLYPQKCNWTLPKISKEETADHVLTKIYFVNVLDTSQKVKFAGKNMPPTPNKTINDTASHFHFARWEGGIADSVTNPFNLPATASKKLYLNAQKAFLKHNTYGWFLKGIKYCPSSSINLRHIDFTNGSYIIYATDTLIQSTQMVNASISFASRQNYYCSLKPLTTPSSADSVKFYLADVERGIDMIALIKGSQDTLPSRYDSLKRIIYVAMPSEETGFFVQERFNCVNCYFPPNWKGVEDTFEVDDTYKHTLGHKLTVKQPNGLLKVVNSSKIDMCEGMYLQNEDSIIIEGPCQSKAFERKTCKGIDSMVAAYSDNSAIIITAGSALVLEPGSYTYIKNGGAIYVKANGSLIIKAGAFVQIGDSGTCNQGWGEIIAEPGAFIHIEPDAHIEYRKTIGDTVDRNMFIIPTAAGLAKAFEGVEHTIKTILQNDNILPNSSFPFFTYPICGLDTTTPIINREWGYTNFGKPYATFQARNDTLCPGEPLHIKLNRILNDAFYRITVCRMDSIQISLATGTRIWVDTCIHDTIVQDVLPPDPVCREPRNTPEDWTYYFNPGTLHRVTVAVWSECEAKHDTTAYIYTSVAPNVEISLPTTVCEGVNTFSAGIIDYFPDAKTYSIEVTEKIDTSSIKFNNGVLAPVYSKTYFGVLPSTIGFDDYFFKGGRTYMVSLTITNQCGSTTVYDSISIPLGVKITLSKPTVYGIPISGTTAIQLNGLVSTVDSFRWEPNTWLDNATVLNPISTPTDSITYVLIGKQGTCTSTDTAHIKYNRYANAGYNDTLCLDSTHQTETLIGFPYDMSLFLGMLYHLSPTDFMDIYNTYNTNYDADFFRYFTQFMHDAQFEPLAAGPCASNLYNYFVNTVDKKQFFGKQWFLGYYKSLVQFNDASMPALDKFNNELASDPVLNNYFRSLGYDWSSFNPSCVDDLIHIYASYRTSNFNDITTTWTRITGNDTTNLTQWDNYFVAVDAPQASSKYILSVITPSRAEIDEITLLVDTTLTPLFVPAFQFDSTVFFMNYTEPFSTATNYEWNFGDGSTNSLEQNPIHTFPAFDSNYVVCLTASNKCSSWQYCDTVWIDSLHLGGTLKTVNKPAFFETNISTSLNDRLALNNKLEARSKELVALQNYPNPFNQATIIDYQIWQNFSQAELRITNILGQILYSKKLQKPIDKVEIDGSNLANGLYYYSIVVDDSIKLTKTMSVIH